MNLSTRKLVVASLLVAFSFVGALIKIFGTIAFDTLPAFLGGLILGPVLGGAIGFIGHFLTAMTSGFPYGLPVHLVIAVGMFATVYAFTIVCKKIRVLNYVFGCIVAVIINGPLTLLCVMPFLGKEVIIALMVPLSIVAFANCFFAVVIFMILKNRKILTEEDMYV